MIERVTVDRYFGDQLDVWKNLRQDGWSVEALIAPDQKTVVFLACKEEQ
jgi:hypothetical protein